MCWRPITVISYLIRPFVVIVFLLQLTNDSNQWCTSVAWFNHPIVLLVNHQINYENLNATLHDSLKPLFNFAIKRLCDFCFFALLWRGGVSGAGTGDIGGCLLMGVCFHCFSVVLVWLNHPEASDNMRMWTYVPMHTCTHTWVCKASFLFRNCIVFHSL